MTMILLLGLPYSSAHH